MCGGTWCFPGTTSVVRKAGFQEKLAWRRHTHHNGMMPCTAFALVGKDTTQITLSCCISRSGTAGEAGGRTLQVTSAMATVGSALSAVATSAACTSVRPADPQPLRHNPSQGSPAKTHSREHDSPGVQLPAVSRKCGPEPYPAVPCGRVPPGLGQASHEKASHRPETEGAMTCLLLCYTSLPLHLHVPGPCSVAAHPTLPHAARQRTRGGEQRQELVGRQRGQVGQRAHALAPQLPQQLVVHVRQLQQRRVALCRRLRGSLPELAQARPSRLSKSLSALCDAALAVPR